MNPSEQIMWLAKQINQVPTDKLETCEGASHDLIVDVRAAILMDVGLQAITNILMRTDRAGAGKNFRLSHALGWAMVALTYQRKIYRDIVVRALDPFKKLGIDVQELYPHLRCLSRTEDMQIRTAQ